MEYSPVLSTLTAIFEIVAAVYALIGPGRRPIIHATAAILLILAAYQILEMVICMMPETHPFLPHLAFIVITWLPPTGLLLINRIKSRTSRAMNVFVSMMYGLAVIIILWISLDKHFVTETICTIVFARYSNPVSQYVLYCIFYWMGLLCMIILSATGIKSERNLHLRNLQKQVLIGTASFIIPSIITLQFMPEKEGAAPSILCHFALLLAIFLFRLIYMEQRISRTQMKNGGDV